MFDIKVFSGDFEVIKDGVAHVTNENILKIVINNLEIHFDFVDNTEVKGQSIEREVDREIWKWKLVNFNNSLGTGLIEPFEMGTLKGIKLYISFFVWTPGSNGRRVINYVLYSKKA